MRGIHTGVICLLLGGSVTGAAAPEARWRAAGNRPGNAVPAPAPTSGLAAGVSLGRPVPPNLSPPRPEAPAILDPQVTPASLGVMGKELLQPVVRMQNADPPLTPPEPQWPTADEKPVAPLPAQSTPAGPRNGLPPGIWGPMAGPAGPALPTFPAPAVCPDPCCFPGESVCLSDECIYGSAEFLLWWIKNSPVPSLVTTSPVGSQGIIGQPGTVVLFGRESVDRDLFSGGRFTLGGWLDPCWALEGSIFFLAERAGHFGATSTRFPLLARPFFNINDGIPFSQVVTDPDRAIGGIRVLLPSQLWGTEATVRRNVCCGCCWRLDLLGGFRYVDLHEGVNTLENGVLIGDQPLTGSRFLVFDNFDTRNQFYGGQLGFEAERRRGCWFVNVRGKVALGPTHQTVNISGGQTITAPDGTRDRFRGGLLALPSNIGTFHRDHFSVVPEAGLNIGYQFGECLRAYVGYTFLYWSNVLRPGDQIDRALDINQIPNFVSGPATDRVRPRVPFQDTSFWAQGINIGLELRY